MDYKARDGSEETKRVDAVGGFPANYKMYLGSHMRNDCNRLIKGNKKRDNLYNTAFEPNLGLVALS